MKNVFKWIFDISLLVMIAVAFIYPQSIAMTGVALWAWFGIVICSMLICAGIVGQCAWVKDGKSGIADITRRAFGLARRIRLHNQFRFVIMTAAITASLLNAGMLTVALCYLGSLLSFRFLRSVLLMLSGAPSCSAQSA